MPRATRSASDRAAITTRARRSVAQRPARPRRRMGLALCGALAAIAFPPLTPVLLVPAVVLAAAARPAGLLLAPLAAALPLPFSARIALLAAAGAAAATAALAEGRRRGLERRALIDPLTGLYRAEFFSEALEVELRRVHRYGGEIALVILDLDDFKQVNDRHGHADGNEVLRGGGVLRKAARDSDVAARFGGEELVLLVRGDERSATAAAARVVEGLRDLRFGGGLQVTCSAGVAALGEGGDSASLSRPPTGPSTRPSAAARTASSSRALPRRTKSAGGARRNSQRSECSRIGPAASAAAKRLPSRSRSGRSLASTARSWKNGTSSAMASRRSARRARRPSTRPRCRPAGRGARQSGSRTGRAACGSPPRRTRTAKANLRGERDSLPLLAARRPHPRRCAPSAVPRTARPMMAPRRAHGRARRASAAHRAIRRTRRTRDARSRWPDAGRRRGRVHAHELRERDAVAPVAIRVALGTAHAVLGSQWIVH